MPEQQEKRMGIKANKQRVFFAVLIFLVIVLAGLTVNFYLKVRNSQDESKVVASGEIELVVAEVSKLMMLPTDETPTVATVQDPEKLKDQPFFANAQNGYKVLIYAKAKKAILYDPVAKKIVEVAPLNINEN